MIAKYARIMIDANACDPRLSKSASNPRRAARGGAGRAVRRGGGDCLEYISAIRDVSTTV
jgi:hypothetical protein